MTCTHERFPKTILFEQFPGLINQIISANENVKEEKAEDHIEIPMPTPREVEVLTLLQKRFFSKRNRA